jgi:NAD(P)-dependent dehydrogenase (short-subunit alcohol dehydrogenase family)
VDRLKGKVAIVTGGASGIGRASARLMAAEGAAVCVGDIDVEGGQRTISEISHAGGRGLFVRTDVSVAEDVAHLVDATVSQFGALHVLHNNAYWARPRRTVLELDEADWDRTLAVCVKSMFLTSRSAIPRMLASGGGSIVNMASAVALVGSRASPAYVAAKGAIVSFTRSLAIDFGKQGIRANCIAPGSIATAANADRRNDPSWSEYLLEHSLLTRTGVPEDIASAVVYLACDESAYVTGITLVVDGGATSTPHWGPFGPAS